MSNAYPLDRKWICELLKENDELRADVRRLAQSEGDLLDEIHALRKQVADLTGVRDELQQMLFRNVGGSR